MNRHRKVKSYEEHFTIDNTHPPIEPVRSKKIPENAIITDWLLFKDNIVKYIWTCKYQIDELDKIHDSEVYCSKCKKWLTTSRTVAQINRHFKVHSDTPLNQRANVPNDEHLSNIRQSALIINDSAVASMILKESYKVSF